MHFGIAFANTVSFTSGPGAAKLAAAAESSPAQELHPPSAGYRVDLRCAAHQGKQPRGLSLLGCLLVQIELLSSLIMVGFLMLDLSAPLLEALLLGLTTGAIMVLYLSLFDLDYPFGGLWRVEPLGLRRLRRELEA